MTYATAQTEARATANTFRVEMAVTFDPYSARCFQAVIASPYERRSALRLDSSEPSRSLASPVDRRPA